MRQTLKKGFTIAVSVMTAFWSVGIAAFAPISAAAAPGAAAVEGDLVKGSLAGVYYVGADAKRYVASNFNTYDSWYPDFSLVQTLTDSELAAIPLGGNMTYRPSAMLIKIQTDPKVYMVGANASLHPIPDEATALALFGADWATKIQDVPDVFFTNYVVSADAVAATLGVGGKLPTGTVVMQGATTYLVGETEVYRATGPTDRLGAAVMASDAAALTSLVGTVPSTPTSMNIDDVARPDRSGSMESGTGGSTPGTSGVTFNLLKKATGNVMASNDSQTMATAEFEVCNGTGAAGAMEVTQFTLSAATGTVTFNDIILFLMFGGNLYEVSGTQAGDTVAEVSATNDNTSVPAGTCTAGTVHSATSAQGGIKNVMMTEIATTAGTGAAASTSVNETIISVDANPVNTADLTDLTFANPTPAGGPTLQTDGTKQKVFGVQATVSNNDMLIPHMVFKVNGTIQTSDCDFRVNGSVASTDYVWSGKYIDFALPAGKQVFDEGTDTWETWCNIDGEAGQTITPQIVWPAPGLNLYDNVRVQAAVAGKEMIAPQLTRLTASVPAPLTLAGASSVTESINVINVVGQNDEKTAGATNTITAAFRVKVRGSKGTLGNVTYTVAGTDSDTGFANCQIKIGMRVDKGEINLTSVDLADYSLSNYGSQNNIVTGTPVVATANKQLQIGDHLFLWECDAVTAGAVYVDGDVMNISITTGVGNLTFDIGSAGNFPTGAVAGTTITVRLLTALAIAPDSTVRNLVQNGNNQVMGVFTITGPTQEGVDLTSVAVIFPALISGITGCTTATLADEAGAEITTSQSLPNAGATLTFSVVENVPMNTQFQLQVVCLQASSAVGPVAGTPGANLGTLSGTGDSSAQSFSFIPAGAAAVGAALNIVASGTVIVAQGSTDSNQIIGPDEMLKALTATVSISIHEAQELDTLNFTLTRAAAAVVSEITKVTIKAEGFTIAGTAAAAETTICERTVTGVATAVTLNCGFSSGDVTVSPGATGTLHYYVTGNSVGNIGLGGDASADNITASLVDTTDIIMKGVQSQTPIVFAGSTTLTGRVVTPSGATVRVVNQSPSSRFESGKLGMEQALMDLIVGSANISWTLLSGTCYGIAANGVCDSADDTVDIVYDSTVNVLVGGAILAGTASTGPWTSGAINQLVTQGTHSVKVLYNDIATTNGLCSASGETVQFGIDGFGFVVGGLTFAIGQSPLIPDISSATNNEEKFVNTTCG